MDEVRNDGRSPDAKTHCDLHLGGHGRRAKEHPLHKPPLVWMVKDTPVVGLYASCKVVVPTACMLAVKSKCRRPVC